MSRATEEPRDALIARYMPLAMRLAHQYAHSRELVEDVEQVAALGLVKAAGRFDESRGFAFSSYAVPTIVGEIKRYFRDTAWAVHVPRALQETSLKVDATIARLSDELRRVPSASEVAATLGWTVEQVLEARAANAGFRAESLDAPADAHGEASSRGEGVGVVDDGYERVENRLAIRPAIASLPERDQLALSLRYEGELSQREIGERIGISQMHVSRILRRSLARVRAAIEY
jgi:RNA polymerase sigma-B factor